MADEIRHLTEGVAFRNLHQTWRYFKQTILPQSPIGDSSLQREPRVLAIENLLRCAVAEIRYRPCLPLRGRWKMADEIRHLTEGVAFRNLHQT